MATLRRTRRAGSRARTALTASAMLAVAVVSAADIAAVADTQNDAAPRGPYTGSEACGQCHAEQLASWKRTAHARAGSRIAGMAAGPARRCQACHTTGDAPTGPARFADVGCEACHGAGTRYAEDDIMRNPTLARALGLRDLSTPAARAAVCDACHFASTRLEPFEPEAAWKRIAH